MIDISLLDGVRDENAFLFSPRACFAIIVSEDINSIVPSIEHFTETINQYSPLRVRLEYVCGERIVVQMKYSSAVEQLYFSHLMWNFSLLAKNAWIHLWDTHEHDALRRDFSVPEYMDSLLCLNRLWIRNKSIYMITRGFSPSNPHGELIEELPLTEAFECLCKEEYSMPEELNKTAKIELEKPQAQIVDVNGVFIPRKLLASLSRNPWLISPLIDCDPTSLVTEKLSQTVNMDDEVCVKVAIPQYLLDLKINCLLTIAQSVSLGIKVNCEAHIDKLNLDETNIEQDGMESVFLLDWLQQKLMEAGVPCEFEKLPEVHELSDRYQTDWTQPFSILSAEEELEWKKKESMKMKMEEKMLEWNFDDGISDDIHLSLPMGEDKNTVEKLQGLLKEFKSAIGEDEKSPGANTTADMGMYESLNDEDIEKLTELEGFDDFVEFFAQHYMGFNNEDLEAHRNKRKRTDQEQSELELELESEFDWDQFNNESDYDSYDE